MLQFTATILPNQNLTAEVSDSLTKSASFYLGSSYTTQVNTEGFIIGADYVIEGNYVQYDNASLTIAAGHTLTVQGCTSLGGTLYITSNGSTRAIEAGASIDVINYQAGCRNGEFSQVLLADEAKSSDPCRVVSPQTTYSATKLTVLFVGENQGGEGCGNKLQDQQPNIPVIVGSVIGSVVGVVILTLVIIMAFPSLRHRVFPYHTRDMPRYKYTPDQ